MSAGISPARARVATARLDAIVDPGQGYCEAIVTPLDDRKRDRRIAFDRYLTVLRGRGRTVLSSG